MSVKVNFTATDAGFTSTVKKVNDSMKGMDSNVKSVSGSVKASFASMAKAGAAMAIGVGAVKAAIGAVTGTLGTFKDALDMGGRLSDFAARTGETVDNLVVLERAFQNNGLSAEKSATTLNKMQRAIVEAGQGLGTAKIAFETLGLQLDKMWKMSPAEQFDAIGRALQKLPTAADRSAAAMQIFGRSGAELLTLFGDFDNEISRAKDQIGSFGDVMGRNSVIFDRISDNITVIKGKFLEFAAGMLDKLSPAIALATELLTRFDAAAAGMRLAEVITGASNAMKGFSDAFAAVKLGEFGEAFSITWNSIKLQAADSINSIYANVKATITAASEFITTAFGPGSGIWTMLTASIDALGTRISLGIGKALKAMLKDIPGIGKDIEASLTDSIAVLENEAKNSANRVSNSLEQIPGDFKLAADEASRAFDDSLRTAGKLVDTTKMEVDLQKSKIGLLRRQVEEAQKSNLQNEALASLEIRVGNNRVSTQEKMAKETKAYASSLKDATKELKEQLTLSQSITQEIAKARAKDGVDRGGRLEARARKALSEGNFGTAQRAANRIQRNEQDAQIREAFGGEGKQNKSLQDIAREQGIDTFRKTSKDLRNELSDRAKQRQKEMTPGGGGKKGGGDAGGGGANDPQSQLQSIVTEIKTILSRIEPKLPPAALGV